MASMPYGLSPHRKKNPRQCDRCRERAIHNFRPQSGPIQYLCEKHKIQERS